MLWEGGNGVTRRLLSLETVVSAKLEDMSARYRRVEPNDTS